MGFGITAITALGLALWLLAYNLISTRQPQVPHDWGDLIEAALMGSELSLLFFIFPNLVGAAFLFSGLGRIQRKKQPGRLTGILLGGLLGCLAAAVGILLPWFFSPLFSKSTGYILSLVIPSACLETTLFAVLGGWFSGRDRYPEPSVRVGSLCRQAFWLAVVVAWLAISVVLLYGRYQAGQVERAVRATLDNFCIEPDAFLMVVPGYAFPETLFYYLSNNWRLVCLTGLSDIPLVSVDRRACEVNVTTFQGSETRPLAVCPWGQAAAPATQTRPYPAPHFTQRPQGYPYPGYP